MFKAYSIIFIFFYCISVFSYSNENQYLKLYQQPNQNLEIQESLNGDDDLIKEIDSARKKLKSQELRLLNIQKKIIKSRMSYPK